MTNKDVFDIRRCTICPRNCGADRTTGRGRCLAGDKAVVSRAAAHFWEEPPISGERGSGAVFFSGCSLGCRYCQNSQISKILYGIEVDAQGLAEIFRRLEGEGAENINLVTGSHFAPQILDALEFYKPKLPVVFNCGGYEKVETVQALSSVVDVWLPDFKYSDAALAKKLSNAEDYPEIAAAAIGQMLALQPKNVYDARGVILKGVIIRHLVLPGCLENTKGVLEIIKRNFGEKTTISLMSQYTPMGSIGVPFNRELKPLEYKIAVAYAEKLGFENGFIQGEDSRGKRYIPEFFGKTLK